jgi:hypothetical protein
MEVRWMLAFLVACGGLPKPGPPPGPLAPAAVQAGQTRFPTVTAASLEGGRQLFLHHCNTCHRFPALGAYTVADWRRIVPSMASRAKLSTSDGDAILSFILVAQMSASTTPTTAPAATSQLERTR